MVRCQTYTALMVVIISYFLYKSANEPSIEFTTWNEHIAKLNAISTQLKQWSVNPATPPLTIQRKSHAASTRFQNKSHLTQIDLSSFTKVISVNRTSLTAWIECSCNMEHLVDSLLSRYNLIPKVIPEFKHITAAGAIQGLGIESTSFKYGLFHNTALQYELLLTNGTTLNVSHDNHPDIFHAIPGSLNTIATVIAVEISLVAAKSFVLLEYNEVIGIDNLYQRLTSNHAQYIEKYDFLEIIRDEKNSERFVEIVGVMRDDLGSDDVALFDMSMYFHELFYQHVFSLNVTATNPQYEYIKLKQYLFRHDRGAFFVMNDFPNHMIFRLSMYWMMNAKQLFKFRNRKHTKRNEEWMEHAMAVHDYMVSEDQFLLYYNTLINKYYPSGYIWFCPVFVQDAQWNKSIFANINTRNKLAFNIGIYLKNNYSTSTWHHTYSVYNELEQFLCDHDGIYWFYGPSYLTETQFWKCYNQTKYEDMRKKLTANLPDIYRDKVGQMTAKYCNIEPGFDLKWNDIVAYDSVGGSIKFALDSLVFVIESLMDKI